MDHKEFYTPLEIRAWADEIGLSAERRLRLTNYYREQAGAPPLPEPERETKPVQAEAPMPPSLHERLSDAFQVPTGLFQSPSPSPKPQPAEPPLSAEERREAMSRYMSQLAVTRGLDPAYKDLPDIRLTPDIVLSPTTKFGETFYRLSGMIFDEDKLGSALRNARQFGMDVRVRSFPDGDRYATSVEDVQRAYRNNGYQVKYGRDGTPELHLRESVKLHLPGMSTGVNPRFNG